MSFQLTASKTKIIFATIAAQIHITAFIPALMLIFLFPIFSVCAKEICRTVVIDKDIDLHLSAVEKRLICGDRSEKGALSRAWSKIPANQAQLPLKGMLQTRGYLNSSFKEVDGILYVTLGEPTLITRIVLMGAPSWLDVSEKRQTIGEKLTPTKLDELEQWTSLKLRFNGYPCPTIHSTADQKTGEIVITIDPGPEQRVSSIKVTDRLGLQEGTLRRYDAFKEGFLFDARDLTITERRIVSEDIVASTYFTAECAEDGAHIYQSVVGGPPRSLRLGFGLNTEQYFLTRIGWRHARLDNRASLIDISLAAGYRIQQLDGNWKWYYSGEPREYLRPNFTIKRDKEQFFETNSLDVGIASGRTWDQKELGWQFEFGPAWRFDNTVVGIGAPSSRSWLFDGNLQLVSHDFEYYKASPRTGFRAYLDGAFSNKDFGSTITTQRLLASTEVLWNINHCSPPAIVIGIRAGFGTTITDRPLSDASLPTVFRYYLGGSRDLRGFSRQELPENGFGALTYAYTSLEGRFNGLLPYQLQPYLFVDTGKLGSQPLSLSLPLYWSPGFGVRWDSPIGVVRGSLANGYIDGFPSHLQFYLSYGEEF